MKVIGIVGKAGSGKDTVAIHLSECHGFVRGQFARALKDMVCTVYGWDRSALDHDHPAQELGYSSALAYKEEVALLPDGTPQCPGPDSLPPSVKGMTRRQVLQHVGTEGFRHCAQDTWVCYEMARVPKSAVGVVFPDVRFLNEAVAIRKLGGEIWRVVKVGGPGTASTGHRSETEMDQISEDQSVGAAHGEIPLLLSRVDRLLA